MSKQEKIIIVFLLTMAFLGLCVNIYKKTQSQCIVIKNSSKLKNFPQIKSGIALININTADKNMFESLPGIGPVLSDKIIKYRKDNGPFLSTADVCKVPGIGESIYKNIKHMITIDNESR